MSRIATCFKGLRAQGKRALIPYLTAGDPHPKATVPLMHAMVQAGANLVELGVPFSDPMADGPVIQAACERALKHEISMPGVLQLVEAFRAGDEHTPVILMGYLNPVEIMGYEAFAKAAAQAGVDGVIIVDLPPEEASDWITALARVAIDPIFLMAPTTTIARIEAICQAARGFIYYVSLKGVTGAGTLNLEAVECKLAQIRACATLPIGVGFGIRDAAAAARMAKIADAVVVGSALVECIAAHGPDLDAAKTSVCALLREMRQAMDAESADAQVA